MSFNFHPVQRGCCGLCDALDFEFTRVYAAAALFEASLPIIKLMCPEHLAVVEHVIDVFRADTDDDPEMDVGV